MRWGERSAKPGALGWVRPLHSIVATFGPETEEPEVVAFEVDGIAAGDETRGHRFLAPEPFKVRRLDDYMAKLEKAKVVLDPERRQEMILADAKNLAFAQGYELVEDAGLLAEVAGLVEWPVVLMGSFDAAFLSIPPEVIRATIRNNQKCFVLRDPKTAKLDQQVHPGGQHGSRGRRQGDRRRQRARHPRAPLRRKILLRDRSARPGSRIGCRNSSTSSSTRSSAPRPSASSASSAGGRSCAARRCRRREGEARGALCKADLLTEVVGEFPELQGLMGKYYAVAQGEDEASRTPCEDHYKPHGPNDLVPTDPVSIAVALADKIDTLVGFWAIDEKPTGSKDPYAFDARRWGSSGSCWRTIALLAALQAIGSALHDRLPNARTGASRDANGERIARSATADLLWPSSPIASKFSCASRARATIWSMRCSRSKARTIWSLIVRRVEALGKFLDTEDGKNLLAGYKRATNIIRIEEKKDGREYVGRPDPALYRQDEEWALSRAIDAAKRKPPPRSRRRISRPPCARWPSCARMSMPSSTR